MFIAAAQARKFYEHVASEGRLFTFCDDGQLLIFPNGGFEVIPFWSSQSRLERVQKQHPKFRGCAFDETSLMEFVSDLAPRLHADGVRIGVNGSGERLRGYDVEVAHVLRNLKHYTDR
ncbi:MAG: DUF2750 domain-containing protein [Myxococcota bacterium]